SNRYISDRFLPDKAIDLVDEAAAKLRTEIDSMPTELDEKSRRGMQVAIEREALKREKEPAARERRVRRGKRKGGLKAQTHGQKAQCQAEKQAVERLRSLREQIEQTKVEIEQAERRYDLNKAAELKYGKLHDLEKSLKIDETLVASDPSKAKLIKEE